MEAYECKIYCVKKRCQEATGMITKTPLPPLKYTTTLRASLSGYSLSVGVSILGHAFQRRWCHRTTHTVKYTSRKGPSPFQPSYFLPDWRTRRRNHSANWKPLATPNPQSSRVPPTPRMDSHLPGRRPLLGFRPRPLSRWAPPCSCGDQRRALWCCWRFGRNMRAVALQQQAAGCGKPDKPVCEAVLLLWDLHLLVDNAFSRAATPEAVLVLLAPGGNGWRVGKWDHCEDRRGYRVCFVEGCDAKGSPNYWDGNRCTGDDLCSIPAVQSVRSQWKTLNGTCYDGKSFDIWHLHPSSHCPRGLETDSNVWFSFGRRLRRLFGQEHLCCVQDTHGTTMWSRNRMAASRVAASPSIANRKQRVLRHTSIVVLMCL